jgi:hypothetical protein
MAANVPTPAFLASLRQVVPSVPESIQRCTWDANAHLKGAPRLVAKVEGGRLVMTAEEFVPTMDYICVCGVCQVGDGVGGLSRRLAAAKGLFLPPVRCCCFAATATRARAR